MHSGTRMLRRTAPFLAPLALLLAACDGGGGSPTETTPKNAQIGGSWAYTVTNLTGAGLNCSIRDVVLTFNQSGTTFSGTYSSGTLNCGSAGSASARGGVVASGTVSGTSVAFDMDTTDWRNTGTLSGATISGTTTMRLNLQTGVVVMTGTFSAVKQ